MKNSLPLTTSVIMTGSRSPAPLLLAASADSSSAPGSTSSSGLQFSQTYRAQTARQEADHHRLLSRYLVESNPSDASACGCNAKLAQHSMHHATSCCGCMCTEQSMDGNNTPSDPTRGIWHSVCCYCLQVSHVTVVSLHSCLSGRGQVLEAGCPAHLQVRLLCCLDGCHQLLSTLYPAVCIPNTGSWCETRTHTHTHPKCQ